MSTPKNPTFFSIPKKIPQCFCISKFYYLSSGKLKHANFNFGFGQKQNYELRLCYCWFELMKNTIPKKIPVLFSRPKKIPTSFIDPKKSLLAKISDPKNPSDPPPVIKICEWGPWGACYLLRLWLCVLRLLESLRTSETCLRHRRLLTCTTNVQSWKIFSSIKTLLLSHRSLRSLKLPPQLMFWFSN